METIDRKKLPESYLNWLDSGELGQVEYQGSVWQLREADAILEELIIDGKRLAFHKALSRVAESLVNTPPIQIEGGGPFDRSRLAKGFALAEDNFDFLFIDTDGSIWAFWHSALSVSKVGSSFSEVLKSTKIEKNKGQLEEPESILGSWTPVSSETHEMELILEIYPIYSFESGGSCVRQYVDEIAKDDWSAVENDLDDRLCISVGDELKYLEHIDMDTLSFTNDVKNVQVTYRRS